MTTLAIDAGTMAIKTALKTSSGKIETSYTFHKGEPETIIANEVKKIKHKINAISITGSCGKNIAKTLDVHFVDPATALIAASTKYPNARHIIDIGGATLSIVDLDNEGRFSGFRTNSLCAAGTGSFLDEQAARMKLDFNFRSNSVGTDTPPRIAARCAVFAKSDLIHRQQEGFSTSDMWSGLCKGLVSTALATLFKGRKPEGPIILSGAVALNGEVVKWLKKELEVELIIPEDPSTFSAVGALNLAKKLTSNIDWSLLGSIKTHKKSSRQPKLELKLSSYPSFNCKQNLTDNGTEIRIHSNIPSDIVLGIDIGSTSTKAAVIDLDGNVVADLYRRTSGNPINASKQILSNLKKIAGNNPINIKALGTTGSGRKMIGTILGADRIINEITAHAKGASSTEENIETIFEIGGQDSKFISMKEGAPHDSNMNYVCAAGTGSFVEEQASKLGFSLTEIGDAVMGTEPPHSSDRCTVFMEQDVHSLLRAGHKREEAMGSVLYSVVQNYINRVVGKHPYSKKHIHFMGATARNKGLIAAFEQLLKTKIIVSPFCHVMGALGVAKIALEEIALNKIQTKFEGFSIIDREIILRRDTCKLCSNKCQITFANTASWGYMCGKDPSDTKARANTHIKAIQKRTKLWMKNRSANTSFGAKTIGIPKALLAYGDLPLWKTFFSELGVKVVLSSDTSDKTIEIAADYISSDYCYPIKLAHGHVVELMNNEKVDAIFLPYIVQGEPHDDNFKRSVFCPYNISFPSIIKSMNISDDMEKPIISTVINFQYATKSIIKSFRKSFKGHFNFTDRQIERAWTNAKTSIKQFKDECEDVGKEMLQGLKESGKKAVVLLGRPYNIYDLGANLNIPQKIADLGFDVIGIDTLPLSHIKIDPLYKNMYWSYGRKILQAATFVANEPNLYAVYLTNFSCGPDSFLQTFVEKIMKGKPMLMLEFDEHSADAGYLTRLEAFHDVISKNEADKKRMVNISVTRKFETPKNLWIPPMHPYGTPLMAAALRFSGLPARPLPTETLQTFQMAKAYTRGTECVPAPSTIGAFLNVLKSSDAPEKECFFMPSAKGPCRFGQYHTLHRIILDDAGYKNTAIEAWDDESGSYGMDMKTSRRIFNTLLTADILYKARCRIRPYALNRNQFDETMQSVLDKAVTATERGEDIALTLHNAASILSKIKRSLEKKPLIGIVGEIYVRLNPYTNQNLVETIENEGGEAWVAPFSEWIQYLSFLDTMKASWENQKVAARLKVFLKNTYMMRQEKILTRTMLPIIGDRLEPSIKSTVKAGEKYFPREFDGESILTVGRAVEFAHQGTNLIINCAPFGCMPGTLTSGILERVESEHKIPVVSLFFDGETDMKHLVRTYLTNISLKNKVLL